jgi:hypothetical protein
MDEGYKAGKKQGVEEMERKWKDGQRKGIEQGIQLGEHEERAKWLAEGHGPGICVSAQRHTEEMEKSTEDDRPKETDTWKHGYGHCVSVEEGSLMLVTEVAKAMASREAEPTTRSDANIQTDHETTTWSDANTHMAPRTDETAVQTNASPERWCAALQTDPPDNEGHTPLKNAETTLRIDSSAQTTATSPSPSPLSATSSLTTAPSVPSTTPTTSTTTTTTLPTAPKRPPAPQKRRHTLPRRTGPFLQHPQPPLSSPEPSCYAATSQLKTAATPAATTPATVTRATANTQTATNTLEATTQTGNRSQRRATTQQTEPPDYARTRSSERFMHSTEPPLQLDCLKRQPTTPPTAPCCPQLKPPAPVLPHEPMTTLHASNANATSSSTRSSTTAVSPALPHSGPRAAAPEPPGQPQPQPRLPSLPKTPRKRTVSPPPASHTPTASLTTLSTPTDALCSPPNHLSLPISPSPPHLDPKQTVSTPPTRFDWADDAASLPTAPSTLLRDISSLNTGCRQPFGTLRRRTRRRRAPPRIVSSRKIYHPAMASLVSSQPFITRCHPYGIGPGKPVIIAPFGVAPAPHAPPALKLDWDQDPRLANLSCALRALGWTPPC